MVANCLGRGRRRSLLQRCGLRCLLGCRNSCTWGCLAELWFCCVCILGCCVLYPLLPRRKRLALVCCCCCCISGLPLCRFVKCMSSVCVIKDKVIMLYPSGCLNPITLHICLIMFTGRLDTVHCQSRVSVLMRADLTALPLVIQPPCDRLRYPVLADYVSLTFYQSKPLKLRIALLKPMPTKRDGSWHLPS